MALLISPCPSPLICAFVILYDKGIWGWVIKLRIFEIVALSWIIWVGPMVTARVLLQKMIQDNQSQKGAMMTQRLERWDAGTS